MTRLVLEGGTTLEVCTLDVDGIIEALGDAEWAYFSSRGEVDRVGNPVAVRVRSSAVQAVVDA